MRQSIFDKNFMLVGNQFLNVSENPRISFIRTYPYTIIVREMDYQRICEKGNEQWLEALLAKTNDVKYLRPWCLVCHITETYLRGLAGNRLAELGIC